MLTTQLPDSPKLAVVTSSLQGFTDRTMEHNKALSYLTEMSAEMNGRVYGPACSNGESKTSECPSGLVPELLWLLEGQDSMIADLRYQVNTIAALIHEPARVLLNDPVEPEPPTSSLDQIMTRLGTHNDALAQIDTAVTLLVEHAFDVLPTSDEQASTSSSGSGILGRLDQEFTRQNVLLNSLEAGLQRLRTIG